jgi:acetyl esterase
MPVNPRSDEFVEKTNALNAIDITLLDPVAARVEDKRVTVPFLSPPEPVDKIENHLIQQGSHQIPVRIYWPKVADEEEERELYPMLVFFHGGGWVLGDLDISDEMCSMLCNRSASIVISVDYRLAPENKFPRPVEDCYAATKWVASYAEYLEGDRDSIIVAGESAGGNLAAAVCLLAKDRGGPELAMQVLIYPITDLSADLSKYSKYKYPCGKEIMDWFIDHYLENSSETKNSLASPVYGDLTGLPPAIVVTAEYDPLRDQDLAYAEKLEQSGVKTQVLDYPGMIHGFVQLPGFFAEGKDAIEKIASEISKLYVDNPS